MTLAVHLAVAVRERAGGRCQYCLMDQSLQGASFHVEHTIPWSGGGASEVLSFRSLLPFHGLLRWAEVWHPSD
jgi:hypothetical protein